MSIVGKRKKRYSRYGVIPEAGPVTVIKADGTKTVESASLKEVKSVIRGGQETKAAKRRGG